MFGNKYSKVEQVCNPFWVVALLVTKFPKELSLVHKSTAQLRTLLLQCHLKQFFIEKVYKFNLVKSHLWEMTFLATD